MNHECVSWSSVLEITAHRPDHTWTGSGWRAQRYHPGWNICQQQFPTDWASNYGRITALFTTNPAWSFSWPGTAYADDVECGLRSGLIRLWIVLRFLQSEEATANDYRTVRTLLTLRPFHHLCFRIHRAAMEKVLSFEKRKNRSKK
jgi:hypothetical protein